MNSQNVTIEVSKSTVRDWIDTIPYLEQAEEGYRAIENDATAAVYRQYINTLKFLIDRADLPTEEL